MRIAVLVISLPALASCVATSPSESSSSYGYEPQATFQAPPPRQHTLVQGMIGASSFNKVEIDLNSNVGEVQDSGGETFPLMGGAFQNALSYGENTHFGFEAGFTLGWQGDSTAVAVGNGSILVVADNDIFLFDFFGGPFFDVMLGQRTRIYVGVGPQLQWGTVELDWDQPIQGHVHTSDSGFGVGWYARTGIEFAMRPGMLIGFGVRWVDSYLDLSGEIDRLDFEGEQYYLTVTESF